MNFVWFFFFVKKFFVIFIIIVFFIFFIVVFGIVFIYYGGLIGFECFWNSYFFFICFRFDVYNRNVFFVVIVKCIYVVSVCV